MPDDKCLLCDNPVKINEQPPDGDFVNYNCDTCGKYSLTGTATAVIHNPKYMGRLYLLSGYIKNENMKRNAPRIDPDDIEKITNGQVVAPVTALEKIHHLLFYLEKRTRYFGQEIFLDRQKMFPIIYAKNHSEFRNIMLAACEMDFVRSGTGSHYYLTIEGYNKIEQLKEANIASKKCFVAISFEDKYDEIVQGAIIPALTETEFNHVYLKTKEHNELIDDEIISGIKNSRFIIAEFSSGNQGVYFEAGYAMGIMYWKNWTGKLKGGFLQNGIK